MSQSIRISLICAINTPIITIVLLSPIREIGMYTIEIDFEVFKEITARRATENITENDVLRELLGLAPKQHERDHAPVIERAWVSKGVVFPSGTKFRAQFKGIIYEAVAEDGCLLLNGQKYHSPSAAAVSITGNPVNGWTFWECKLPGKSTWILIKSLRKI